MAQQPTSPNQDLKGEYLQFGGMAVPEGVMMRSPNYYSVACRAPSGQIVVKTEPLDKTFLKNLDFLKKPFLRGSLAMIDTMALGTRAMRFASDVQLSAPGALQDNRKPINGNLRTALLVLCALPLFVLVVGYLKGHFFGLQFKTETAALRWDVIGPALVASLIGAVAGGFVTAKTRDESVAVSAGSSNLDNAALLGAVVVSLAFGFFVFKVVPESLAQSVLTGKKDTQGIGTNYLAEVIKVGMFIGYLSLIRLYPPILEVFRFHGAEHKAINVIEADQTLTPEHALAQTRLHPRCGTNFAIVVLLIGFLVFPLIPRFGQSDANPILVVLMRLGVELVLLPLIAGVAYEIIRAAGKAKNQAWVNILLRPGLATQLITTAEPEKKHVEVAIASLESVIKAEREGHLTNVELDPGFDTSAPSAG